jgi:hypothetical protein
MKRTLFILAVVLFSAFSLQSFASVNTLQGSTFTEFGNYTLVPANEVVVINNVAYKKWDLNYSGNQEKFEVLVAPGIDGNCCITVRNEHFEISYANNGSGFGVRLVDTAQRSLTKKEVMKQIDYDKFVSQQVLTTNPKSAEEYLGLVACFMPLLFG